MKSQPTFIFWAIYLACMTSELVAHRCDAQEGPATTAAPAVSSPSREPSSTELARGKFVQRNEKVGKNYRKHLALVIGIDYKTVDRQAVKAQGDIPTLNNAERCAEAMKNILEEKYQFKGDRGKVVLLTGKEATRENIGEHIRSRFLGGGDVSNDDCALVYFAGHGSTAQNDTSRNPGYLLSIDAELEPGGTIDPIKAIGLDDLQEWLGKSQARHKLLILDSCFSASLYKAIQIKGVPGGLNEHLESVDDGFIEPAFQALTASRATASDGKPGDNSPFTAALLATLDYLPLTRPSDRYYFTTNQLFVPMKDYTRNLPQSAQCRWLDDKRAGEFHFFPDANAQFGKETGIPDGYSALLMAMVPSTFGNWWADEMPWFMPSLRMEILKQVAASRSAAMPEPREIANAAKRMFNTNQTAGAKLSEREAMRVSHLRFMFEMQPGQDRIEIMNTLINGKHNKPNQFVGLLEATQQDDAAAEDLHYLAVLYQKCAKPEDARKYYERALQRYAEQEKNSLESKVLRLLCLMDLGILELEVMNHFRSASERFVEAGRRPGTPGPFVAFCLIKQADALRRNGLVVTADHRMDDAIRYLEIADPSQESQLTIAAHKYRAWGFMESWRFQNAKEEFDKTLQMLDQVAKLQGQSHPERVVDKFHVKHGLAMIHRFQGDDRQALSAYRELTPEIMKAIEASEDSDALGQAGEVRDLLYERLVNSLERQADCSLFGQNPDYAEAADDYRRALDMVEFLPEANQDGWRADLKYRRVIALALDSLAIGPASRGVAPREPLDSFRLAENLMRSTPQGNADRASESTGKILLALQTIFGPAKGLHSPSARMVLNKEELAALLAQTCLNYARAKRNNPLPAGATASDQVDIDLRRYIFYMSKRPKHYDRDELERLMFAHRLVLQQSGPDLLPEYRLFFADSLIRLCTASLRTARLQGAGDRFELLRYLRPYFNAAFLAKAKLEPGQVKELIELVHLATSGRPYNKFWTTAKRTGSESSLVEGLPVLALYHAAGQCYLLLDVPGEVSRMIVADRPLEDVKLMTETGHFLSCPDELHVALDSLRAGVNRLVTVIWEDRVQGIVPRSRVQDISPRYVETVKVQSAELEKSCYFPFNLRRYVRLVEPNCETTPTSETAPTTAAKNVPPAVTVPDPSALKSSSVELTSPNRKFSSAVSTSPSGGREH